MCGIWCCFHNNNEIPKKNVTYLEKRGPDQTSILILKNIVFGFAHLKINGDNMQPLNVGNWWILCNGEIFNHKSLEQDLGIVAPPKSSDCWILPYLFDKYGPVNACKLLDGEFAIIAFNTETQILYACRDTFGIKPLFFGKTYNAVYISSEIKALDTDASWVSPGSVISFNSNCVHTTTYFDNPVFEKIHSPRHDYTLLIKAYLTEAVRKRCMSDKPVAALLSGGLDSSIICAILSRIVPILHTFSIGMADSPDLENARIVSKHLGTVHHEIILTPEDFKRAVPEVIRDIESYDVTTVRASVGNWLLGKHISENTNFKVIFNGDGSDELLGGYLYFHRAPSDQDFEGEIDRLLSEIHMFDVLRSERSMSAYGLESRTPYLDINFVSLCRSIPTEFLRDPLEKSILRDAFKDMLPLSIIQRKKEAFSDGVSLSPWFKRDNEKQYYSDIFSLFYKQRIIPHMWMPRWCPETSDPSARTLDNYKNVGS
jgi:asparagine synthase (glutamine-hydrolysing)